MKLVFSTNREIWFAYIADISNKMQYIKHKEECFIRHPNWEVGWKNEAQCLDISWHTLSRWKPNSCSKDLSTSVLLLYLLFHFYDLMFSTRWYFKRIEGKENWQVDLKHAFWEQGSRSGESSRLPPTWSGFDFPFRRHMGTELVGSLLCSERFYPEYSGFVLSPKTNIWFDLLRLSLNWSLLN